MTGGDRGAEPMEEVYEEEIIEEEIIEEEIIEEPVRVNRLV